MKKLKIVFFGTPDFAVAALKTLIENGQEIVGVVTAPDKPAGRGRQLQTSAVKKYTLSQNLPILQPENLKSDSFQKELEQWQPDLQIVVAFRMLPKSVWSLPAFGTFNLHASLLPAYRGAAPINWALMEGEIKTGVTTFFIDDKIDTGEILLQKTVSIDPEDNAGSLHDKLMEAGSKLVLQTVKDIESNSVQPTKQLLKGVLKTAYKLTPENTKIDWTVGVNQIHNKIRGLSPYPAAWSYLYTKGETITVKIYKSAIELTQHNLAVGSIQTNKKSLMIAVKDGFVSVLEMQLPGKKNMDIQSLLNGFSLENESKML